MTDELPPGWVETNLRGIVTKLVDGSHNPPARVESGLPMLSAQNVSNDGISFDGARMVAESDFERESCRTRVTGGDVLLTIVGSIGRTTVVPEGLSRFTLQRSVAVMTPQGVDSRFLSYQFRAPSARQYFEANARGTAQKGIYLNALGEMPIRIAPQSEQKRIASKIDELFSRIDEGERALERVSVLVERYRQSVLKAAVTGELTRAWREKNKETLESGEALLARILTARREAWEKAELEKMKAKGSAPTAEKWKQNNAKIAQPATFGLPKFPAGWQTVRLATIAEVVDPQPSHRTPPVDPDGVPYLGIGDIRDGRVNSERARKVSRDVLAEHRMRYSLSRGDFIFGKIGTIGQPVSLVEPFEYTLSANVVLVQPRADGVNSSFVRYWMASNYVDHLVRGSQRATAQPALGIQKARDLACPLPPTPEQDEIVSRVDNLESVADGLIDLVQAAASRSIALRQAVLSAAFAGRLVAQCDSDEPASILLQRIATERASDTAAPKRGRKKKITA